MIRKQLEVAKRRLGISEREAWRCNTRTTQNIFIKATTDSWEPLHLGIYFRLCIFITDTTYLIWRAPLLIVHHFLQPQALRYEHTAGPASASKLKYLSPDQARIEREALPAIVDGK